MTFLNKLLPGWLRPASALPAATDASEFALTVSWLAAEGVVKISSRGKLTLQGNDQIVAAAVAAFQQYGSKRFLVDDREAVIAMNFANVYDLPEHNSKLGVLRDFRVALLFTPNQRNSDMFKFYEDRNVITDFQQRVFTDEQVAMDWLLERQSPA